MKTVKIKEGSAVEEKLLAAIASRGKWLGGNRYILDNIDLYELTAVQVQRVKEIANNEQG